MSRGVRERSIRYPDVLLFIKIWLLVQKNIVSDYKIKHLSVFQISYSALGQNKKKML